MSHSGIELTNYGDEDIPVGPRVSAYPLNTAEWRQAFLTRFVDVGYVALDEAADHVYDLLIRPRGYHCALVAQLANVRGSGRSAVFNTLRSFLDEWLQAPSMPSIHDFTTIADWHRAVHANWSTEHDREKAVIVKYAAWLNGEHPTPPSSPAGELLKGPWKLFHLSNRAQEIRAPHDSLR